MSLCHLRSMSPLHLQYLKNMGVTGTLVVSLVREGRLWGLIACHHYAPRYVPYPVRALLELLAEVISTRIAAIENYVQSQVEVLVKRLELRMIEATSTDGDWRMALFRNSRTLLSPVDATGAALFHDGEVMTAGDVPSTPDLRALLAWVSAQPMEGGVYTCSSVVRRNPGFAALAATASGVMAVPLSPSRPDWLMWFRKETALRVHLGRRSGQAGDQRRSADAVAAPLVRCLVGNRARHGGAVDPGRNGAGQGGWSDLDRHHPADPGGAAADRPTPAEPWCARRSAIPRNRW